MPTKGKKGKNSRRSSISRKTANKMNSCMWGGNSPVTVNTGAESYARYIYGNTNEQTTNGLGGNLIKMNNPSGWIGGAGVAMGELKQKIKEIKTSLSAIPKLVNQAVKENKNQTKTRKPKQKKMVTEEPEEMNESKTQDSLSDEMEESKPSDEMEESKPSDEMEESKPSDEMEESETPYESETKDESETPETTETPTESKKGGSMLGAAIVPAALLAANQLYKPSRALKNLSFGRKSGLRKTLKKLYKRKR
jgi:hypothetical protein